MANLKLYLFSLIFLLGGSFGLKAEEDEQLKEWTVMVFLNADNNLHGAGIDDINEMEKIGSTDKVNIIVQFDGQDAGDSVRYLIEKDQGPEIKSKVLMKMGEVDMGSWVNFSDFAIWTIDNYPAKKYIAVVWNHGSGWIKTQFRDNLLMGISYDDDSYNHMTTPQLGMALKAISEHLGRKIDIYGSDACLMGMLEVAYELKDYADVVVGSEETEPFDGWPYDDFLQPLSLNPEMVADELAHIIVSAYGQSYSGGSQGSEGEVTLSAVRTRALKPFVGELNNISEKITAFLPEKRAELLNLIDKTQPFSTLSNRDLFDFLIKTNEVFKGILDADGSLYRIGWIISDLIINNYADSALPGALGLAIWMPRWEAAYQSSSVDYSELAFSKDSIYPLFLQALHASSDEGVEYF